MAKKGGGEKRAAVGVVPFRGGAEPSYAEAAEGRPAAEEATAAKPKGKARVVPIGRSFAGATARPAARRGKVETAGEAAAEAKTQTRAQRRAPGYRPAAKLAGKVALLSGDGGGARAVARLFAREGADAALVYAPGELSGAEEVRRDIEAAGQHALLLPGDVREPDFCRQAVERAVAEYGQLDVLVHAARHAAQGRALEELRYEDWDRAFKSSVHSLFLMAQAAAPRMARGGAIIAVGMAEGLGGEAAPLDYAATQGAMHAFTRALAQQLRERGIRVNGVIGIGAKPEEAAPACVFFASADAGHISGETIALG